MVLLNVDLGELDDEPEALYALADLVNVACGGHAGDAASMRRAVDAAARHGASVGAHPSFPDREGFGRRSMPLAPHVLRAEVRAQCAALRAVTAPGHCKAHGALYHAVDRDPALADAFVAGVLDALGPVTFVGPRGGALEAAARGMPYLCEGFADRAYGADGRLLPRGTPGALLGLAEAAAQARRLADTFDTLCVHGDSPDAVAIATAVRAALGPRPG